MQVTYTTSVEMSQKNVLVSVWYHRSIASTGSLNIYKTENKENILIDIKKCRKLL